MPEPGPQGLRDVIEQGHYVLLRLGGPDEVAHWRPAPEWPQPTGLEVFPYYP